MRLRIFTRKTGAAAAEAPSRTLFIWLVGGFFFTLLPHVPQMPAWLTVAILIAMVVRCLTEWRRWPLPTTTSTGVVAICLAAGVYLQYNTILGHEAGTPFMAGLLVIKFYELRSARDVTLIIFASFFVVMSALLFSQAIELFIYCLLMMWLLTGILLRTYMGDHGDQRLLPILGRCSTIFLQAVPLALLLFFFFPRYAGRFQLSFDDTVTGLTDHVEPGSIAKLADDDSPAMRVYFVDNFVPTLGTMYWRAIVLWHFDGSAWTRGLATKAEPRIFADQSEMQPKIRDSDTIRQKIILWPQGQRWIPALDRPVGPAENVETSKAWSTSLRGDVLVPTDNLPIDYKHLYFIKSSPVASESSLSDAERKEATQLPEGIDPRVQALANKLYAPNPDTNAYVRAVLHYFRSQHFALTTDPGVMDPKNPVADFLFRSRRGFCEHYASAFGVLMRLKNIPARMVVGYRGGEYNPYHSFYLVSQSNAHAWNEVWVDTERRWVRVDATTIISEGSSFAIAANGGLSDDDDLSISLANHRFTFLSAASLPPWMRTALRDVQMRREDLEAQWDDWVFSYDPETQDRLAEALGLGRRAWWVLLLGCLLVVGAGGTAVVLWLKRQNRLSPTEEFYALFCRRMAQRGAPRAAWEGPRAYAARLAARFPEKSEPIDEAGWIVAEYRYGKGEEPAPEKLRELLRDASEKSP